MTERCKESAVTVPNQTVAHSRRMGTRAQTMAIYPVDRTAPNSAMPTRDHASGVPPADLEKLVQRPRLLGGKTSQPLASKRQNVPRPPMVYQASHRSKQLAAAIVAACGVVCAAPAAGQVASAAVAVQRHGVRLDSAESAAVERGETVLRVLATHDQRDVAVLGIVRVNVSRDVYLRRVQDFRSWLRTPTRTRLGVFSDPAVAADVEDVQVTSQDAKELRQCKPGDCSTKLPATAMQRLQDVIDWNANDVHARITALAKRRMVEFVEEYRDRGNASMPVYDDRPTIRASDAFVAVLAQSTYLNQVAPAVVNYLKTYPRGRPGGVADVLYWSEDAVPRLRPILSVTHAVVYTPPELSGATVVASKQIYANHYFEAALEVLSVLDRESDGAPPATYLVMERRFRFDNLPQGVLNIRGRAVNGLRDQLRDELAREKVASERLAQR